MTLGLILFLMVCVAFVIFSNEITNWLTKVWSKPRYKLLISMSLLTLALVIFVRPVILGMFYFAYGYYYTVIELSAYLNIGPIGNLFVQTLLLTLLPLGITYLIAILYRLRKRKELKKTEQFLGVFWCLMLCVIAWHISLASS